MSSAERKRILLTGDESTGTLAAVRGLHRAGYEVWLAVYRSDTYAARSRCAEGVLHVTSPGVDSEGHVRALADAARRLGAVVVLPGTEGSLRALTGREALLPEDVATGTCAPAALARATDKGLLATLARDAGLDVPETVEIASADAAPDSIPFPAVVKPLRSVDAAGPGVRVAKVHRASDREELRRLLDEDSASPRLLQPYIVGTLAAVCGVAWEGQVVCAVHQRSPRIWPPGEGNSSYAETTTPDREREAAVAALVAGWPFFHAALASGADDSLDALSRTYSYLSQRLILFAVGLAIACVAGLVGLTLVDWLAFGVLRVTRWSLYGLKIGCRGLSGVSLYKKKC